jgi:hypothetical protein
MELRKSSNTQAFLKGAVNDSRELADQVQPAIYLLHDSAVERIRLRNLCSIHAISFRPSMWQSRGLSTSV